MPFYLEDFDQKLTVPNGTIPTVEDEES